MNQPPGTAQASVYLRQHRTGVTSFLEVFDAPSIVTTCTRRLNSTIPLQSLSLMNSDFVIKRAERFATLLKSTSAPATFVRASTGLLCLRQGASPTRATATGRRDSLIPSRELPWVGPARMPAPCVGRLLPDVACQQRIFVCGLNDHADHLRPDDGFRHFPMNRRVPGAICRGDRHAGSGGFLEGEAARAGDRPASGRRTRPVR